MLPTFLAGIILGSAVTRLLFCRKASEQSNELPDKMQITLDVDIAKIATIFDAISKTDVTAFYVDFPGLYPETFCRIYFLDSKKRMEQELSDLHQ
jgi:hypothetical protein